MGFRRIGINTTTSAAITTHKAETDPHPQYTTATELTAAVAAHEAAPDPHTGYQREGQTIPSPIGFYGATPMARQTVTGATGGNDALESLLTVLENIGLINNASS